METGKDFLKFILDIIYNKNLIWELSKKDFQQRYVGNYLGILWAFIQPIITVFIFWFVFQVGFKSVPVNNFPFILWLVAGLFPWFFFSDAITSATNSIVSNVYLVKKVVFRLSLLPMVQVLSAYVVHCFFLIIILLMYCFYGYMPDIYNIQILYYDFALICLLFGLSLITSCLVVFLKDIGQLIGMLLQFGFWATPIFWNLKMIPEEYRLLFKYNPMYYIINGYRDAFINKVWFWERGYTSICFWMLTVCVCVLGVFLFKKLRPHFADVL